MKSTMIGVTAALSLVIASAAGAAPLKLKPASPQPSPKSGLSVKYAWGGEPPSKIQSIDSAKQMMGGAKRGKPLRGLDYRDTNEGDPVLTYNKAMNVAAEIQGYIRFDAPGVYEIETWSNDGIDARISGQSVGYFSGRQGCDANQRVEVEVPQAGWYDLKMHYFQKYGTACLMMKVGKKGGKLKWAPNNIFGH